MRLILLTIAATLALAAPGCGDDEASAPGGTTDDTGGSPDAQPALACDAPVEVMTTAAGVDFVRTPDACFEGLPDWPYEAKYVEIEGLRQAYAEDGPSDGPVVLLLHGQPSWPYLYRKMIPVLADAGYRVIAMDHLGMGRSDKPTDIASYSYIGHCERLEAFIEALGLTDIHLFVQDWGSLIGLRVAGLNPDWFARIAVGDGMLPVIPEGIKPFPEVEDPNEIDESLEASFSAIPDQQVPFYAEDGCTPVLAPDPDYFGVWMEYAMKAASFTPSEVVEALTWFDLPSEVEAAYDAPFPSREYMAGPRVFPSLVNELGGANAEAWAGLTSFTRPFLTIWAGNDPGNLGQCETQNHLIDNVPGAAGQPHTRLPEASHFLQEDQGVEIATRLVAFYGDDTPPGPSLQPPTRGSRYCELLFVHTEGGELQAKVWGTQGLNDCPAELWEALDTDALQAEEGALAVVANGPRYWLPDTTLGALPGGLETKAFGGLEMRFLATVQVAPGQTEATPYAETTVLRNTTFIFDAGSEIYELTSPDGGVYVMQSMSRIVDPEQSLDDLAALADRLSLPAGWTYAARTLQEDLTLVAQGEATVTTDDLTNTYQRVTDAGGQPRPGPTLPVLDDGTGTPCADDSACAGLEASHCLSVSGTGYCTIEGCGAGACGAPYVCCGDCSPAAADFLPFDGSACIPGPATDQLTSAAGCTCD